jgi:hypothetical protein
MSERQTLFKKFTIKFLFYDPGFSAAEDSEESEH